MDVYMCAYETITYNWWMTVSSMQREVSMVKLWGPSSGSNNTSTICHIVNNRISISPAMFCPHMPSMFKVIVQLRGLNWTHAAATATLSMPSLICPSQYTHIQYIVTPLSHLDTQLLPSFSPFFFPNFLLFFFFFFFLVML